MDVITLPFQGGAFIFRNPGRRRKRLALGCYAPSFQPGKCTNSVPYIKRHGKYETRNEIRCFTQAGTPSFPCQTRHFLAYFHVRIQCQSMATSICKSSGKLHKRTPWSFLKAANVNAAIAALNGFLIIHEISRPGKAMIGSPRLRE